MKVTGFTRMAMLNRRFTRNMVNAGWEAVGENGGKLWELYRGYRTDHRIVGVVIAPDGKSLWVRIEKSSPDLTVVK